MKENNFLKNIKASLDEPPRQSYDEGDWELLSEMLDDRKSKKRFGFWFWGLILILFGVISSVGIFAYQKSSELKEKSSRILATKESSTLSTENTNKTIQFPKINTTEKANTENSSQNNIITNQKPTINSSDYKILSTTNLNTKEVTKSIITNKKTSRSSSQNINIFQNKDEPNIIEKYSATESFINSKTSFQKISFAPKLVSQSISKVYSQQKSRRIQLFKLEDELEGGSSSGLKMDSIPLGTISYSKRKMIGVYTSRPFIKSKNTNAFQNPLLFGIKGRYFLNPRWNLELDLFHIRLKENRSNTFSFDPTPSYTLESVSFKQQWFLYQFGASYWLGNNQKWHPYLGLSFGGLFRSNYISTFSYRNKITNELVGSRRSYSDSSIQFAIPIFINYRAGILYRFKNPRFNCQLEVVYNQLLLNNSESPFLPSINAGIFYHF